MCLWVGHRCTNLIENKSKKLFWKKMWFLGVNTHSIKKKTIDFVTSSLHNLIPKDNLERAYSFSSQRKKSSIFQTDLFYMTKSHRVPHTKLDHGIPVVWKSNENSQLVVVTQSFFFCFLPFSSFTNQSNPAFTPNQWMLFSIHTCSFWHFKKCKKFVCFCESCTSGFCCDTPFDVPMSFRTIFCQSNPKYKK
jgi:hypothetical protein